MGGETPHRRGHNGHPGRGSQLLTIHTSHCAQLRGQSHHKMEPLQGCFQPRIPREKAVSCLPAAKIAVFAKLFYISPLLSFYCILLYFILAGERLLNQPLCLLSQTLRGKTARKEIIEKLRVFEIQPHPSHCPKLQRQ